MRDEFDAPGILDPTMEDGIKPWPVSKNRELWSFLSFLKA